MCGQENFPALTFAMAFMGDLFTLLITAPPSVESEQLPKYNIGSFSWKNSDPFVVIAIKPLPERPICIWATASGALCPTC